MIAQANRVKLMSIMIHPSGSNHILRVECADAKGLIHKITGVLFRNNLNIVQNAEYVDHENRRFFMRTEFSGHVEPAQVLKKLKPELPKNAVVQLTKSRKKDIVIFATKEHHCLGDLLVRHAYGELHANIVAVISNHASLSRLTASFHIPFFHVSHENRSRAAHEAAILKILGKYKPEYLVLAKYMRIFSRAFVALFEDRIINIHHSFLPAFAGANPYQQAADRGVKIIGATAHFVTGELDKGPIIAQDVMPVDHSHSVTHMTQAGRDVEKIVLARALRLAFEDRIFVSGHKTILFD